MGNSNSSSSFYYSSSSSNKAHNSANTASDLSNNISHSPSRGNFVKVAGSGGSTSTRFTNEVSSQTARTSGREESNKSISAGGGGVDISGNTNDTVRSTIISGNTSLSTTTTTTPGVAVGNSTPRSPEMNEDPCFCWKGPFQDLLQPQEAAKVLGSSTTRRIIRAFRRVIALNQPFYFKTNDLSNNNSNNDKYIRQGIYCYEDTGTTSNSQDYPIPKNNPNNRPPSSSSANLTTSNPATTNNNLELVFLNEEHYMETKEIDAIMDWFFPKSGKINTALPNQPKPPTLAIDFLSFRHLILPPHVLPPNGLLDCIFTSMATTTISRKYVNSSTAIPSLQPPQTFTAAIALPDFISFVAILQHGTIQQKSAVVFKVYQSLPLVRNNNNHNAASTHNDTNSTSNGIRSLKKALSTPDTAAVTRDTINRFVFNIYGNDFLQSDTTQQYLQDLFNIEAELAAAAVSEKEKPLQEEKTVEAPVATPSNTPNSTSASSSSSPSIPLDHFIRKMTSSLSATSETTASKSPSHILLHWLISFSHYAICPPPTSSDVIHMEESFSTMTRKLQITCARYSLTPLMMLECKRKFYSMLQLSSDTLQGDSDNNNNNSSCGTTQQPQPPSVKQQQPQQQQQQQKHISLSQFLTVMKFYLPQSLAKLTFIAGSSSSCCTIHHSFQTKKKSMHGNSGNAIKPLHHDDFMQHSSEQRDIRMDEQSNSFSTLHRTYSAVHPQGFALDMIPTIDNTGGSSCCTSIIPPLTASISTPEQTSAENEMETSPGTSQLSSDTAWQCRSSCTCCWTLYDSIHFSCSGVRTNCTSTPSLYIPQLPSDVARRCHEDLPLLYFAFRVFSQDVSDDGMGENSSIWTEEWWLQEEDEHMLVASNDTSYLSKRQIGRMVLLLLEHYHFRNRTDHRSKVANANVYKKGGIEQEFWIIQNSQICVFQKDMIKMGFFPAEVEKHRGVSRPLIPLNDVVQIILTDFCQSSSRMYFTQFVEWQIAEKQEVKKFCFRLGLYLQELRLVAGVAFGVQPSNPRVERELILELFRRHQLGHPVSPANPRGPPGTLWNLICSNWMDQWNTYTSKAARLRQNISEKDLNHFATSGFPDSEDNNVVGASEGSADTRKYGLRSPSVLEETLLPPTAIDNNGLLLAGNLVLRSSLRHIRDFLLVPPLVWDALQAWYDGGPPIERKVTIKPTANANGIDNEPTNDHHLIIPVELESEVELYPFCLTISLADSVTGQPRPFQQWQLVSRIEPMQSLLDSLCCLLNIPPENARLWKASPQTGVGQDTSGDYVLLNLKRSLSDQMDRSEAGIVIMLEVKRDDGIWPCAGAIESAHPPSSSNSRTANRLDNEGINSGGGDGIVGLHNMGNTCYLSSSMQCLSHTPLLREYFTSKSYLSDINTTNPLGYQGRLAQVSANLLLQLWRPNASGSAITPKGFKDALGKFNDIFSGNEQHDAQELLAFLLSGLSEDLNRIVDKPYIEQPDSDGRPDSELADIWWKNHLLREMSIIVALFTGQYKSLLTCKTCGYESARFEPFAFLQLPLQEDELIPVTMIVYPIESSNPVLKYSVRVNKDGTIYDLLITLCKIIYQDELSLIRGSDNKDLRNESSLELKRRLLRLSSPEADEKIDDDEEEELDDDAFFYSQMANNFAVVDMRECRINSITPSSRSLVQVRESDVLCVYEIDPMCTEKQYVDTTKDALDALGRGSDAEEFPTKSIDIPPPVPKPLVINLRSDYIALAQRRLEPISRPYLHQFSMRIFGVPLLLRLVLSKYTGSQLYDLVAERMKRFLPVYSQEDSVAMSLLRDSTKSRTFDQPCATKFVKQGLRRTTMDLEEVVGGSLPRYGFRLRLASRDGQRCSRCSWFECCIGCTIPDDENPTAVQDGDTIVIDWHLLSPASRLRIDVSGPPVSAVKEQTLFHACVERHRSCRFDGKDITLEECLDKFTKEEEIPDAYCSKCKDFRTSTKHMSVWRLPPIMIIHLKRFQFTQHFRRKLRNMVVFPIEGLDLSRIVAAEDKCSSDASVAHNLSCKIFDDDKVKYMSIQENATCRNNSEDSRSPETLYDLYAVVHHLGALTGGHYVASVRSEKDGKWRIFNDAQVTEVCSKDIVDASAYILFYLRRDMKNVALEDVWDITSRVGEGVTEDQIDKLVKQRSDRCIVS